MRIACWIPKAIDTLRVCNTYRFSTTTMVARTRLSVTLYVHCLYCYIKFDPSSPCETFGGRNGIGTGFCPSTSVPPHQYHSTIAPHSSSSYATLIRRTSGRNLGIFAGILCIERRRFKALFSSLYKGERSSHLATLPPKPIAQEGKNRTTSLQATYRPIPAHLMVRKVRERLSASNRYGKI